MAVDLFVAHGLHALHEWPEAQDAALALLIARREAAEKGEIEGCGVIAPAESEESRETGDSR